MISKEVSDIIKANQKRFIEAAKLFEKFLAHTKDHFDGNLNLAGCYHEMGEFEKAILYYNKCIELKSNVTEVYRRLAMCYRFKREYKKAIKTINQDPNLNSNLGNKDPNYFRIVHLIHKFRKHNNRY